MSDTAPEVPSGPAAGHWAAHVSPDGRPYWNHTVTKQSVWEKPSELKTPIEREMEKTPWKEYETGGRKYWVHAETKETTWEMPHAIRDILNTAQNSIPTQPLSTPTFTAVNAQSGALVAPGGAFPVAPFLPPRPSLSSVPAAPVAIPDFQTHEEAERAFMGMLSTLKVTPDWTWEQTMRETVTEPLYKALKSLAERKAAFEKYVMELKESERVGREKSMDKWRKDWMKNCERMGGGTEEAGFKTWWSVERALLECERKLPQEVWNGPRNDEERRALVEEFLTALKTKELNRKRDLRVRNMEKVSNILQSLSLDLAGTVRWREAQMTIVHSPDWQDDSELQRIEPLDILAVYEEELRKAEKEASDLRNRHAEEKRRRGRKAREEFISLLEELHTSGEIVSGTTWKSIYPLLEGDDRYQNLLGTPGSSPLDLFWDVIDELDCKAEEDQRMVESVLESRKVPVGEETSYDDFAAAVAADERLAGLDFAVIRNVYDKVHARVARQAKEDRRRAEKKLRLQVDDLRYAYKKLDPPVSLESTYEDNLERIRDAPEFKALEHDDSARKIAFEKFVKRQKEKLKDRAHSEADSTERRRESRGHRDRDRDGRGERSRESRRHGSEESKPKREASEDFDSPIRRKVPRIEEDGQLDVKMKDVVQSVAAPGSGEVEEGEMTED